MGDSQKILVVDDDPSVVRLIKKYLKEEGFEVHGSQGGDDAVERFFDEEYLLVITEWTIPGLSGIEVCQHIRAFDEHTPIIMLSHRKSVRDRIRGFDVGCDDYIAKPFNIHELVARVKAALRRSERGQRTTDRLLASKRIKCDGLVIDPVRRLVKVNDMRVDLSVKQYSLLLLLASNPGKTYSRRQLLNLLWDRNAEVYEHTVDSHINRLRKKIEKNPGSPRYILTVWGVGYRFNER
ncbi:MAG: response regulator transcription factor [Candidatus Latescibacterota bacterium]|nr:MAG: response regulator transcription factor [Candidatus Latescibacterota bacterium]